MRLLLLESAQLKIALAGVGSFTTILGLPASMRVFEIEDLTRQLELASVLGEDLLWVVTLVKDGIHHDVQHIIKHSWDQLTQEIVRLLHARIGVNFYENRVQLLIYDEVIA